MLESTIQQKVNHWLDGNFDNETKESIKKLSETEKVMPHYQTKSDYLQATLLKDKDFAARFDQ